MDLPELQVNRDGLPPEESEAAWVIDCNLRYLVSAVREFLHTFYLYRYAYIRRSKLTGAASHFERDGMSAWIGIAGRNGAIIVSSIADVMEDTSGIQAPTLWSRTNIPRRRAAYNSIARDFPNIRSIRDAAAHPGELAATSGERTRHTVQTGDWSFIMQHVQDARDDRLIYLSTFKEREVQYELSIEKAQALASAVQEFIWAILLPDVRPPTD